MTCVVIRTKAWSITKIFGSAALVGNDTKEQSTMEKLLTASDLAEILGFAKRSIINMAREKPHLLPPHIRVSDSYRWRPSVVQQWMDGKSQSQQVQEAMTAKPTEKPKRGRGRPRK
jgi:predicted DNA-binding transcriptional regulator AlpA